MDDAKGEEGTWTVSGKTLDVDYSGQHNVKVADRSGQKLTFQIFQGVRYSPLFKVEILQQIKGFPMRPEDIYFSGYPRTGTNWTFEMASMLLNGKAETIQKAKDLMELTPHDELAQLPSPRIVNSHMKLSDSPNDVTALKCKVIYTLRDPKDVAVSLYKLYYNRTFRSGTYNGDFEDFLYLFMAGTVDNNGIFEHWRDAEKYFTDHPEIPVHFQSYEDAIKDPIRAVQTLSDFLGLRRNDDLCRAIAEKCSFSRMKIDKEPFSIKVDGEHFLYKKGVIGDWKSWFNDQMLEDYYRVYEEKMAGSRFYAKYQRVDSNGIFEHWRDAEKYFTDHPDVPVHFRSYEEAIKDPVRAVQALSDFLGLHRNDDLCRAIAEKCSFSRMKIDKEPFAIKVDGEHLLYRKGVVGDWMNWFNDQMLEDYYRVYDEKMAGSRFYASYSRSTQ